MFKIAILVIITFFLSSCEKEVYTLKVKYCNGETQYPVTCYSSCGCGLSIETYKQAVPIMNCYQSNGSNKKMLNVCDYEVIRTSVVR